MLTLTYSTLGCDFHLQSNRLVGQTEIQFAANSKFANLTLTNEMSYSDIMSTLAKFIVHTNNLRLVELCLSARSGSTAGRQCQTNYIGRPAAQLHNHLKRLINHEKEMLCQMHLLMVSSGESGTISRQTMTELRNIQTVVPAPTQLHEEYFKNAVSLTSDFLQFLSKTDTILQSDITLLSLEQTE